MNSDFYLVRKRAVPETLLKVVEVNRLLSAGKVKTIQEAVDRVGISRSSYYKFKNDIEEFHSSMAGMTLTLSMEISDETGILSDILREIADFGANILTIHQSIPIGGMASVSISMQVLKSSENVSGLLENLEQLSGIRKIRATGA
ncbi:MAG: ACT domain-containing protein [Bacillota bacterium]|nr:ACT domain-containing protein [Bacillota bacterium]